MSTLYVIGVGPGDPELLTLKAARLIREVPVVFVPKGREEGKSIALSIVNRLIHTGDKKVIELHFPMKKTRLMNEEERKNWQAISEEVLKFLDKDGAFLTLGDPCLYSTFFYLYDSLLSLAPELKIEIVPGVSSINAAASRAIIPLGMADERIAIIPANYWFNNPIHRLCSMFDTIVFMKVDRDFEELKDFLLEDGLIERSVYVSRVGMEGERVIHNIREVKKEDLDYFSMVIVKCQSEVRNRKSDL
jgi:precorrin-2/cobalt-factor-2 C20-methyltransferase